MVIQGMGVPGMVPREVTEATQGALSHSLGFEPFSRSLAKTLWFHGLLLPSRPWALKAVLDSGTCFDETVVAVSETQECKI